MSKNDEWIVWALGIGALALLGGGVAVKVYDMTRGLRNNNPGNIRYDGTAWQGLANPPSDGAFARFTSPEYGIRAISKILTSYQKRGLNTITKIISTWAPSNENDTAAYIDAVSEYTGIDPSAVIGPGNYPSLVAAIIHQENGMMPYDLAVINNGVSMS